VKLQSHTGLIFRICGICFLVGSLDVLEQHNVGNALSWGLDGEVVRTTVYTF